MCHCPVWWGALCLKDGVEMKSYGLRALGVGWLWLWMGLVWLPAEGLARGPARVAVPRRAAAPRRAEPAAKRSVVMLAARNQAAASKELHQAVSGQVSDASVSLELRWVHRFAASPGAQLAQARTISRGRKVVVVFWCDLSAKGEIFLYLVEPEKGRLIVRSVARAGGGGLAESVAIIVGMSVRAVLSSLPRPRPRSAVRVRGSRPVPVPGSARRPAMSLTADNPLFAEAARLKRNLPSRGPRWLVLEMKYALDFYGKRQMAAGLTYPMSHGVSIGLAARFATRWSAFLSFRVVGPVKANGDPVLISFQRYPVSTGARIRFRLGRWVELGGALAFIFDYVAVDTQAPDGWDYDLEFRNKLHSLIGGEIRLSFLVLDRLRIIMALGAEVRLNADPPEILNGDEEQSIILDPWPVQPYFRFGISLDLY